MTDCKILVVGCNHGIQPSDQDALFEDNDQVKEQKAQFAKMIDALIKQNEIQFVGEEWGPKRTTIAHLIAEENNKIPWGNINTTSEELDAMTIPRDYVHGAYPPEQKEQWTREREAVMLEKILRNKKKAQRFIVICGFEHMDRLAEMLSRTCETVEPVDYRKHHWYDEIFAD